MGHVMKPRRVYFLLLLIGIAVVLLITGHMDLDWQLISYYFDSIQNTWSYWEYCPFIRINWWTAYLIQVIRISVGWLILGSTLTYMGLALMGKLKDA